MSRLNFFLILTIYFMQTLNTGSLFYAALNAIAYFYMVWLCATVVRLYSLIIMFMLFGVLFPFSGLLLGRIHFYY